MRMNQKARPVDFDDKMDRESLIDENLKRVFNEALEEGVPDRFKDLLDQLKRQDAEQGQQG